MRGTSATARGLREGVAAPQCTRRLAMELEASSMLSLGSAGLLLLACHFLLLRAAASRQQSTQGSLRAS